MALAVVDTSSGYGNSVSSLTYSHIGTGANIVVVQVATFDNEGTTDGQVTGITFDGVALTQVVEQAGISGTNNHAEIWYIVNPNQVTGNVVVTLAGSTTAAGSAATSLSGADTANPIDASAGDNTDGNATSTLNLTTVSDNALLIGNSQAEVNAYTSQGADQTTIAHLDSDFQWFSYKSTTTAGAQTITHSNSNGSERHCGTIVSIKESTATAKRFLSLLGAGS